MGVAAVEARGGWRGGHVRSGGRRALAASASRKETAGGVRPAHRAHIRLQTHVCFFVFWGEQEICKLPWGSVTAGFSQKGLQNHVFAGIDASPLVKRETQHETYAPHPSRKRERWRSVCGFAIADPRILSWWTETELRTDSLHQSEAPLGLTWSF